MAEKPYGLIATFDTPGALMHAAEKVRDAGYRKWDCITPFPVHGLDQAMGVRPLARCRGSRSPAGSRASAPA